MKVPNGDQSIEKKRKWDQSTTNTFSPPPPVDDPPDDSNEEDVKLSKPPPPYHPRRPRRPSEESISRLSRLSEEEGGDSTLKPDEPLHILFSPTIVKPVTTTSTHSIEHHTDHYNSEYHKQQSAVPTATTSFVQIPSPAAANMINTKKHEEEMQKLENQAEKKRRNEKALQRNVPKTNSKRCAGCSQADIAEVIAFLIDALAMIFLAVSMSVSWVQSVPTCINCPSQYRSELFLDNRSLQTSYGIWAAGILNNAEYIPISEYLIVLNRTDLMKNYGGYYFPPYSTVYWSELSSALVCTDNTLVYEFWGSVYSMCPYGVPAVIVGAQAFLLMAFFAACFSGTTLVAARHSRFYCAFISSICSLISFALGIAVVVWLSSWWYIRYQTASGFGTIPIRAVSGTAASKVIVVPLASNLQWGPGYYLCILAIVCEIITTMFSWVVATEKFWWAPDVVYGPDIWLVDGERQHPTAEMDIPDDIKPKPTLSEMMDHKNPHLNNNPTHIEIT